MFPAKNKVSFIQQQSFCVHIFMYESIQNIKDICVLYTLKALILMLVAVDFWHLSMNIQEISLKLYFKHIH